jgi:hypothetical protein
MYRCYFLNCASRIISACVFYCKDGTEALHEARAHLADHECRAAAEVWREEDYIGCVLRSDATARCGALPVEVTVHDRLAKCPLVCGASSRATGTVDAGLLMKHGG